MKIVTSSQMREIDGKAAAAGIPTSLLMENAGRAVAEEIRQFVDFVAGKAVLALAGPGNNGGDALVAARYLHEWGAHVAIYLLGTRQESDENLALARQDDIAVAAAADDPGHKKLRKLLSSSSVVIDGILGTGAARPLEGNFKLAADHVNREKENRPALTVAAVDIPTGLNADNGSTDSSCIRADLTVTLGLPKPGLYSFPGAGMCGRVVIADIGIPAELSSDINTSLMSAEWAKACLPARPAGANKGTFGRLLAVCGSENYIGAAYLACMGAARVGVGVVTLSTSGSLKHILASKLTEITYAPLPETEAGALSGKAAGILLGILPYYRILLMGCGLGQHPNTVKFVHKVLAGLGANQPVMVLDADALNILAGIPRWWQQLQDDTIITPHAGEMSRLTGMTIEQVQHDRLEACRRAACDWSKTVVLKGACTIVAARDGRALISPFANPGLASAGTGDVLAGAIAGLAGQGISSFDAAALGVYLHAAAGEVIRTEMGDAGMLATDLLPVLPKVIKGLKELP